MRPKQTMCADMDSSGRQHLAGIPVCNYAYIHIIQTPIEIGGRVLFSLAIHPAWSLCNALKTPYSFNPPSPITKPAPFFGCSHEVRCTC